MMKRNICMIFLQITICAEAMTANSVLKPNLCLRLIIRRTVHRVFCGKVEARERLTAYTPKNEVCSPTIQGNFLSNESTERYLLKTMTG